MLSSLILAECMLTVKILKLIRNCFLACPLVLDAARVILDWLSKL